MVGSRVETSPLKSEHEQGADSDLDRQPLQRAIRMGPRRDCGRSLRSRTRPDGATVRLHCPIPLDTTLTTRRESHGVSIRHRDTAVATVTDLEQPLRVGPFPTVDESTVYRGQRRWLDRRDGVHMAPTCFGCGHERSSGGLQLRPGPVEVADVYATVWRPPGEGRLPSWLVWAALDCPTGVPAFNAVGPDEAVVTGELSVQISGPISAGETYKILSRGVGGQGRFHRSEAVLLTLDDIPLALASATWLSVPLAAVLSSPRRAS